MGFCGSSRRDTSPIQSPDIPTCSHCAEQHGNGLDGTGSASESLRVQRRELCRGLSRAADSSVHRFPLTLALILSYCRPTVRMSGLNKAKGKPLPQSSQASRLDRWKLTQSSHLCLTNGSHIRLAPCTWNLPFSTACLNLTQSPDPSGI